MYAGGTQQYDTAPTAVVANDAQARRGAALDPELAWLDAQLATAPGGEPGLSSLDRSPAGWRRWRSGRRIAPT